MTNIARSCRGTSLVEIMVGFGLIAISTIALMSVSSNMMKSQQTVVVQGAISDLSAGVRHVLDNPVTCTLNLQNKIIDPSNLTGFQSTSSFDEATFSIKTPDGNAIAKKGLVLTGSMIVGLKFKLNGCSGDTCFSVLSATIRRNENSYGSLDRVIGFQVAFATILQSDGTRTITSCTGNDHVGSYAVDFSQLANYYPGLPPNCTGAIGAAATPGSVFELSVACARWCRQGCSPAAGCTNQPPAPAGGIYYSGYAVECSGTSANCVCVR